MSNSSTKVQTVDDLRQALAGIGLYLEEILGHRVDLGTNLRDSIRESVERDLIAVF